MSNIQKKHIDVVASMEEFKTNLDAGMYIVPWIVYVNDGANGYTVLTSASQETNQPMPDALESLSARVDALEYVYCLEDEYEELVANGIAVITKPDGTHVEVKFDENQLYYIYEREEEPEINPDDSNNGDDENIES